MRLTSPSPCTNCGKLLDAAGQPGSHQSQTPEPGDFTLCLYCHHLMVFGPRMILRDPTDQEMLEVGGDERLLEIDAFCNAYAKWKESK